MHVEPACSEMCILQEANLTKINRGQTTLLAGNEPFQMMVTVNHYMWLLTRLRFKQKKLHKDDGPYPK